MIYRKKGEKTWTLRLAVGGRRSDLSTGCVIEADAQAVQHLVDGWVGERGRREERPAVIAAVAARTITLRAAVDAALGGTLDALVASVAERVAAPPPLDLVPLMAAWRDEKLTGKKGAKSALEYYDRLRRLFPEAIVPITLFTRKEIHTRIMARVRPPARSRRRAPAGTFPLPVPTVHPTTRAALALVDRTPGLASGACVRSPRGLAAEGGVTHQVLYDTMRVLRGGTPAVVAALRNGALSLYAARQVATLPRAKQEAALLARTHRAPKAVAGAPSPHLSGATRTHYRAVASLFAHYLLFNEYLEHNVCDGLPTYGLAVKRMVYYERHDAKRLIAALPEPCQGAAAFACGFCAEWCAAATLRVADIDFTKGAERALVKGTKNPNRWRWVPLLRQNAWVLPYLRRAAAEKLPSAPMFPGLHETHMLRTQQRVARELGIVASGEAEFTQHTFHDWRHTHSVQLYRDGYPEAIGAAHLGHANTDEFRKRYGNFKPGKEDYARAVQQQERHLRRVRG